jgi:hypothetical protein
MNTLSESSFPPSEAARTPDESTNTSMQKVGVMEEFFFGKYRCRYQVQDCDGKTFTMCSKPSSVCYIWFGIMVLSCITELADAVKKREQSFKRYLRLAISIFLAFCMFKHCTNCQPWAGFWKTLILGAISQSILSSSSETTPGPSPSD